MVPPLKHPLQAADVCAGNYKAETWRSVGLCKLNVSGGRTGHQRGLAQERPFVAVLYSVKVAR